ncbi:hypothetical protein DYI42_23085, partial [Vannielia litorea]|nr:hypothetical protein [Vannielia litorea]
MLFRRAGGTLGRGVAHEGGVFGAVNLTHHPRVPGVSPDREAKRRVILQHPLAALRRTGVAVAEPLDQSPLTRGQLAPVLAQRLDLQVESIDHRGRVAARHPAAALGLHLAALARAQGGQRAEVPLHLLKHRAPAPAHHLDAGPFLLAQEFAAKIHVHPLRTLFTVAAQHLQHLAIGPQRGVLHRAARLHADGPGTSGARGAQDDGGKHEISHEKSSYEWPEYAARCASGPATIAAPAKWTCEWQRNNLPPTARNAKYPCPETCHVLPPPARPARTPQPLPAIRPGLP